MIISHHGEELVCITQGDHAHLAAELLSLFRVDELIEHPRRSSLLRAVREHDNGWRELDAAPPADAARGRPLDFRSVPSALRRHLWTRGCERLRDDDPYVALLITLHALHLHRDRVGDPEWDEWTETHEMARDELLDEVGVSAPEAAADHAWLRLADACSLAACEAAGAVGESAGEAFETDGYRGLATFDTLQLDPFPLAGRTTLRVTCRRIPDSRYGDAPELGRALARARWGHHAVTVAPPAPLEPALGGRDESPRRPW